MISNLTHDPSHLLINYPPVNKLSGISATSDRPNVSTTDSLKVRIGDYPTFSGKSHNWLTFYEKFTSITGLQGLDTLLNENHNHKSQIMSEPVYASQYHQLYSILKHICARGIVLPKMNMFKAY